MTEQQKFEAWANAKFGPAPGVIPQHERYASLFEAWQARAAQDRSAELLEALVGLEKAYCRAGSPLYKDERHEDRLRLIAARAAISKARGE